MAQLEINQLVQRYGTRTVVQGVSFHVEQGQIACLLGPSGCGKTTLLRCIAGFEEIASGEIRLHGQVVSCSGFKTPPERRQIGMVFQDFALFPHLCIADNVAFGLHGLSFQDRNRRVAHLLDLVGLTGRGDSFPHVLSGGQQQRVALARALAPKPQLVLLDEPFSSLDVDLRERLSIEVRDILKEEGSTAILVTHDQHEAFSMADEIGVIADGQLQQWDTAYRLYHEPINRFVADFVGQGVFLPGQVVGEHTVDIELGRLDSVSAVQCSQGCGTCNGKRLDHRCDVDVLLRPDDLVHDDSSALKAIVVNKSFRGADILYTLALPSGAKVLSLVPSHHNHTLGEAIGIRLDVDHVVAFKTHPPV